jgi:predicted GNAT family acetyltransferase
MKLYDGNSMALNRILEYLRRDSARNLFAIYDLLKEPDSTRITLAVEDDKVTGYLLRYSGLNYPTAIIRGHRPAVTRLLDEIPGQKMILFLDSDALDEARERLNVTAVIQENLMVVRSAEAKLVVSNLARRLTAKDAASIVALYPGLEQTKENRDTHAKWTERHTTYGIFQNGVLVSIAGTWAEVGDGWILGGIYTSKSCRGMGFGTTVTSTITEAALRNAEQSTLFVASSNESAIHVYEKLGYRKVGERVWIDLGTGFKPLTTDSR